MKNQNISLNIEEDINPFTLINEETRQKRIKKRNKNLIEFNKIFENVKIIKEHNNIIEFQYKNNIYYFYQITNIIRRKGNNMRYKLENILNFSKPIIKFGKYKDKTIEEISKIDIKYLYWMVNLKNTDQGVINEINKYI